MRMIGQALYMGAEESGLRGCGIGCFFDEAVHSILGLKGWRYQDLYHFTVGNLWKIQGSLRIRISNRPMNLAIGSDPAI